MSLYSGTTIDHSVPLPKLQSTLPVSALRCNLLDLSLKSKLERKMESPLKGTSGLDTAVVCWGAVTKL